MFELSAQGQRPTDRWTAQLLRGAEYRLGRSTGCELCIGWDPHVSREHVRIVACEEHLLVTQSRGARNPLHYSGTVVPQCRVRRGEHFVVGETVLRVAGVESDSSGSNSAAIEELAFTAQDLRQVRYQDPENRIEVLTHLPEVIAGAQNDAELHHRLANLLLSGVVHAEAAAIVTLVGEEARTLHWDRRQATAGEFHPSRRLLTDALRRGHSVLHLWEAETPGQLLEGTGSSGQTLSGEFDWAYCTPIPGLAGEPLGLYLAGHMGKTFVPGTTLSDSWQLEADVKFTELVAEIIGAVLKARRLERQKAGLRQFFAPPILAALGSELDTTLLEPRECDVTVMFCDLKGFSQRAEMAGGDLIGLLDRVSSALGLMTQQILEHGGVTGDFQGDAALGFWGWPFDSPEAALNACRAALGIRAAFQRVAARKDHPLADFAMGIGIAHGRAVAGKIGTADQVKVTVFGPVVNLASRLEGMTRQLRAPILMDEATAKIIRSRLSPTEGRTRRLARVLPYGLETSVLVHELLPEAESLPELTNAHLQDYERGVDAFISGQWNEAYALLHRMPASDRAQDFLLHQITQASRIAPPGWDGVVRLPTK